MRITKYRMTQTPSQNVIEPWKDCLSFCGFIYCYYFTLFESRTHGGYNTENNLDWVVAGNTTKLLIRLCFLWSEQAVAFGCVIIFFNC